MVSKYYKKVHNNYLPQVEMNLPFKFMIIYTKIQIQQENLHLINNHRPKGMKFNLLIKEVKLLRWIIIYKK